MRQGLFYCVKMSESKNNSKVYFIGAGPGDPDLLTIKAAKILWIADVILYDRLVSPDILRYAKESALTIQTGKQKGAGSIKQSEINDLIVEFALEGKIIVRLKGGDVSFFSNILDELETVTTHGIPFEIIPGVTAASGCAAYAGIPLTARGYADSVRFLTMHQTALFNQKDWSSLAATTDTLVFYMTSTHLATLSEKLIEYKADTALPLCVISQGATPMQQIYPSTLARVSSDFAGINFISPSLVIIGKVVELAEKFKWYEGNKDGLYFKELIKNNNLSYVG